MALVRVYELAKELGATSGSLLTWLKAHGEYVRSASSPLQPEVERKVRAGFKVSEVRPSARRKAYDATPPRAMCSPRPGDNPFATATGIARSPYSPMSHAPRHLPAGARSTRREVPDATRAAVEAVFGVEATRKVLDDSPRPGGAFDGYIEFGWQKLLIDRATYAEFRRVGLGPSDAALAEEILLAGLRPADLLWRIGEETVLIWIARGKPVAGLAKTLLECRSNPAERHLVSAPEPWEGR